MTQAPLDMQARVFINQLNQEQKDAVLKALLAELWAAEELWLEG